MAICCLSSSGMTSTRSGCEPAADNAQLGHSPQHLKVEPADLSQRTAHASHAANDCLPTPSAPCNSSACESRFAAHALRSCAAASSCQGSSCGSVRWLDSVMGA